MSFMGRMMSLRKSLRSERRERYCGPGVSMFSETAEERLTASSIAASLAPGMTLRWM